MPSLSTGTPCVKFRQRLWPPTPALPVGLKWTLTATIPTVYAGPSLPELLIPRTHQLGDYGLVVARLIEIFAQVAGVSENAIYYELLAIGRDAVSAGVSDDRDDGE